MNNNGNIYRPKKTPLIIGAVLLIFVIAIIALTVFILLRGNPEPPVTDDGKATVKPIGTGSQSTDKPPLTGDPTVPATTPDTGSTASTAAPTSAQPPITTLPKPVYNKEPVKSITVEKEATDLYRGSLLLIDQNHGYNIDKTKLIKKSDMAKMTDSKVYAEYGFVRITQSPDYLLKSNSFYLTDEAAAAFTAMMKAYAAGSGNTDVQLRNAYYYDDTETVAYNCTGLYVDLEINRDSKLYSLNYQPFRSEYYSWFIDNCHRFGFIHVRDNKNDFGIDNYSSFRYIGIPHATYMHDCNLSFEAYLAEVKTHPLEKTMTITDDDGVAWQVYYVPATVGGGTTITMRATDSSYTVSGDNVEGYIVTINTAYFAA